MEFRINAEDPDQGFRPDPGDLDTVEFPEGDDVRIDTHVESGYRIPPFYDSMIAKLIVRGSNRTKAISASKKALSRFRVEGVKTTIPIHRRILTETDFQKGSYDTAWLERLLSEA